MQKFMKKRKARGFTLVELLIVIIIIGILAGAMLLVAGAGTDKANATKIVSDMRGIKTAAIMKYADDGNWDWVSGDPINDLANYLDRDPSASTLVSYDVTENNDSIWITASDPGKGIGDKLAAMAKESGLYAGTTSADYTYSSGTLVGIKVK